MSKPPPYDPQTAITKIREILKKTNGYFIPTGHCRRDSMPKRNVDNIDIKKVLEFNGTVADKIEWDDDFQNWKYKVVGKDIEGIKLSVVTVIDETNLRLGIITVF